MKIKKSELQQLIKEVISELSPKERKKLKEIVLAKESVNKKAKKREK
jgi:hypothetical protein